MPCVSFFLLLFQDVPSLATDSLTIMCHGVIVLELNLFLFCQTSCMCRIIFLVIKFGKIFCQYFLKYFFFSIFSPIFFSYTQYRLIHFLVCQIVLRLYLNFSLPFSCCSSNWMISNDLTSGSWILSSTSPNVL